MINSGHPPQGLGIGHPTRARLVIEERARGRMEESIENNPGSFSARLQRYLVVTYPENSNIEKIAQALIRKDPCIYDRAAIRI